MTIAAQWSATGESAGMSPWSVMRSARAFTISVRAKANVWSTRGIPPWVTEVAERILNILDLEKGWDGARGAPVSNNAVETALNVLSDTMSPDSIAPQVIPSPDGGIQLEWHYTGVDLEVYIEPDGSVSAWFREGNREWEEDFYPRARLSKELSLLTNEFCR